MKFLLDTNVVSEWTKPEPEPDVVAWLADVDEDTLFLSVITLAELSRGIELLAQGRRRDRLVSWLAEDLPARFEDRILDVDQSVAAASGRVMATSHQIGLGLTSMDAFIAATADVHSLTLATRDGGDFAGLGIPVFNPWLGRT